jgi:hypothetical protein
LLVLFSAALGPAKAAGEDRFLTNLALLDALATEAVEQVLDSLGVAAGDSVNVLASGYNEGNGFIADAFARSLARRGCSVRMLAGVPETSQETAETGSGAKAPAQPDTLPDDDEEAEGQTDEPEEQEEHEGEDELDELGTDLFDQDSFAEDSTAVSDSTLFGAVEDTVATEDGAADEGPEDEPEDKQEDEPEEEAEPEEAPPEPQQVAAGRIYPPGTTLEFQVLEFGVTYPRVKRRFLVLGTASIQRLAGVYVQAKRIEGSDGEIVRVASGQSHLQDRLSGRSRILAEGAGYPFEEPTVPPGQIGKLAEPLVVLGIVGSLVYLFYQNQN